MDPPRAAASPDAAQTARVALSMPRPVSLWKQLTWAYQSQLITYALTRCGGDVPAAARLLEVTPFTLYRFLRRVEAQDEREKERAEANG